MKRILLVDDDPHLRDVVVYTLKREGFEVITAADGQAALELCASDGRFDLIVLDVMMPEVDGLEVCRRLRSGTSDAGFAPKPRAGSASEADAGASGRRIPIVFLSSRDEEIDKIIGLEIGGDDYVTKPFSPKELAARVRAVLRRAEVTTVGSPAERPAGVLRVGPIVLDPSRHEVTCEGAPLRLTVTEFGILSSLMREPGCVKSRGQLMETAYAYDNLITERTIDTHVKRIRKKFRDAGHDPVETVHGLGYKLRV